MSKRLHAICFLIFIIAFYFFSLSNIYAEPTQERSSKKKNEGSQKKTKVAFTYYFDNRDYNTLNIVTSTTNLPADLKIWGFIDIHGNQSNDNERSDLSRYFLEYRLSRPLFPKDNSALKGLGFEAEYNDFNGSDNDVLRLGLTYKHPVPFLPGSKSWLLWGATTPMKRMTAG